MSGMLRILSLPTELQQKVGSTQLSIPYDAMIRIARLTDPAHQEQLVEAVLGGADPERNSARIDEFKGTKKGDSVAKPKKVYYTKYQATVIIQATTSKLTNDQCMEALQEALGQAAQA